MILTISSGIDSFVQFLTVLILFVFVLGITYFSTKYIAKVEKNKIGTTNIELIETSRISNSKYLQIVKIGSKYFCIAVCKDTVTLLGEVNGQELVFREDNEIANIGFQEILEKVKQKTLDNKKKDTNKENRQ